MLSKKGSLLLFFTLFFSNLCSLAFSNEDDSWAPDFLIVGAQKSGTTSLYHMLSQHPQVVRARREIHFFDNNFHKGVDWYRKKCGSRPTPDHLIGDKSPYYLFHPLAPKRASSLFPDLKIIAILRNPADRAYSHFWYNRRLKIDKLTSFNEALAREEERLIGERELLLADPKYRGFRYQMFSYLSRGLYLEQLQNWLDYFPREQLLVLSTTDLKLRPQETLNRVFAFLGLPPAQVYVSKSNTNRYPPIDPETRTLLVEFYRPHNEALEEFLGMRFDWE